LLVRPIALVAGVGVLVLAAGVSGRLSTTMTVTTSATTTALAADHAASRRLRERRSARAIAARAASSRARLVSALVGRRVVAIDRSSLLS
jgi:hypothetical protein